MRNKILFVASLFIIASMLLGACATPPAPTPVTNTVVETVVVTQVVEQQARRSSSPPPPHPPRNGSRKTRPFIRRLLSAILETLDPALCYETAGGQVIQNTHDTLIFYNKEDPVELCPVAGDRSAQPGERRHFGGWHDLHLQDPLGRQVPRRHRDDPRGCGFHASSVASCRAAPPPRSSCWLSLSSASVIPTSPRSWLRKLAWMLTTCMTIAKPCRLSTRQSCSRLRQNCRERSWPITRPAPSP